MIHVYKNNAGVVELPKGDLELFDLIRSGKDMTICCMCQKTIKRNCYCLGKGNVKYCLDCAPKFIANAIESMNGYVKVFKKLKMVLEKNKTEYLRHNLANSL